MRRPRSITKILTANDVGVTGGHQAGICIPKAREILSFFPALSADEKNPRSKLKFYEENGITSWHFVFIYYNNRLTGGTRNEYRLTWMTKYLRTKNARVGDELVLSRDSQGRLRVSCKRLNQTAEEGDVLRLTGGWMVIPIKGGQ